MSESTSVDAKRLGQPEKPPREQTRRVPDWVWSARGLNAAERLTLARLWRYAKWNAETGEFDPVPGRVYPHASSLAEDMDEPPRTIEARLKKLRESGWIRRAKIGDHLGWELAWLEPWAVESSSTARSTSRKIKRSAVDGMQSTAEPILVDCGGGSSSTAVGALQSTAIDAAVDCKENRSRLRTEQIRNMSGTDQGGTDQPNASATSTPKANVGISEAPECPNPRPGSQAPDPMVADHRRIMDTQSERAEQAKANAAEMARGTLARLRTQGFDAEPHWLIAATAELPLFASDAMLNEQWRSTVEKTAADLGWARAHVVAMLTGYQREYERRQHDGTLAEDIAAFRFPQPRYVLCTGRRKQGEGPKPWHGPTGDGWGKWSFAQWAMPKRDEPRPSHDDRFAQQAEWRRRERDAMYDVPPLPEGVV